ncbi:Crp/Fnr family transcriptional regulator [Clostridium ganghwense]|uniref:Crp/Fnr family transcriptional regulator n=1 Tax=Clostridium ganghwense TaxID=312089 RepID=A0ABT4CLG6_9CLOT|nr:Crp/Fnr family transcriptional regulator [Clostridium ganghwense]MCY6369892.1 Crp/Fnr family transcriptional regulator [Clostridium ganghwense]
MNSIIKDLKSCKLFSSFAEDQLYQILNNINYKIGAFDKDQTIALEGDPLSSIGIVLEGTVEVQKNYPSGKTVTISKIKQGGIFGEVIIFSNMKEYPSAIMSTDKSKIIFISKTDIINLCSSNSVFLNKFMGLLSNKILMLNKKLKNLSYGTIREKLASFLLDEYKKQKSLTINIKFSRQELADQFGTTRPSLSRELINMREDNLIEFTRNTITIIDLEKLEDCLF